MHVSLKPPKVPWNYAKTGSEAVVTWTIVIGKKTADQNKNASSNYTVRNTLPRSDAFRSKFPSDGHGWVMPVVHLELAISSSTVVSGI